MKKLKYAISSILLLSSALACADNLTVSTYYYPPSWGMGKAYDSLAAIPQAKAASKSGHKFIVNVAYNAFNSLPKQLTFQDGNDMIKEGIQGIQKHGGKAVIAFGGWGVDFTKYFPTNNPDFYKSLYNTVKDFGFNGIDFDDENVQATNADAQILLYALPQLRKAANDANDKEFIISFAGFMSGAYSGWGNFLNVLQDKDVRNAITYVNVMDYEDTSAWHHNGTCQNYTVPADVSDLNPAVNCYLAPLTDYATALGDKGKIMMGIMIGKQSAAVSGKDVTQTMSPDNIEVMAKYAQQQGFAGIQYWDVSRDTMNSDFTQGTDYDTGAFFDALEAVQ